MTVAFSDKGLAFLKDMATPLAVDSMNDAADIIAKELARGPSPNITPEQWARHLAWVIGFDRLIADRKAIRRVVELLA